MINLILLGDPASGKATQAKKLAAKYKFYDFDMGKELRKARRKDKKLEALLQKSQDKGKLSPTKFVRQINHDTIFRIAKSKGILFDGHPKMIGEAKLVYKLMNQVGRKEDSILVLYLNVPRKEIESRMLSRVEYFDGKYSKRPDDNKEALKNRIKYYRDNISDVINFFKEKYSYKQISGLGTQDEVFKRIEKAIYEFDKKQARNR